MLKYSYDAAGSVLRMAAGGLLPPEIIGQPADQVVDVGNLATFSVVVADAAGVTYQWSRNVSTPANFTNIDGATADSLEVPNVIAADKGQYAVAVSNPVAIAFSSVATLSLTSEPLIKDPTVKLTAYSDLGGLVNVQPMKRSYALGEEVTLKAVPLSAQYAFIDWAGDLQGHVDSQTLTMDANKSVRARFAAPTPIPPGCVRFWSGEADVTGFFALEYIVRNLATSFVRGGRNVPRLVTALGKVGGAFEFDGTDGAGFIGIDDLDAITLEAWVFRATSLTIDNTIIARGYAAGTTEPIWSLGLVAGSAAFRSRHHGFSLPVLVSPSPIPFNTWTHVAATFDGKIKRLFVNGAEVAAQFAPGPLNYDLSGSLVTIGMRSPGQGPTDAVDFFVGRIDELAIYNRALTQNEVADIYGADVQGKNVRVPYFISASALPTAVAGSAYAQTLHAILPGRNLFLPPPTMIFSPTAGRLPTGIVLSPSDGTISGIPTFPGTFDFVVRCAGPTDADGFTEQLFVLSVS